MIRVVGLGYLYIYINLLLTLTDYLAAFGVPDSVRGKTPRDAIGTPNGQIRNLEVRGSFISGQILYTVYNLQVLSIWPSHDEQAP